MNLFFTDKNSNISVFSPKKSLRFIFIFLFSVIFISCQSIDFSDFSNENHFPIPNGQVYISKIDLSSPNLQIVAKIDTDNFFNLQDFVENSNLDYAINSTPFYYITENGKDTAYLLGIQKINNQIISQPVEKYSALAFYFNEENEIRGKVIKTQTPQECDKYPLIIGGYFTILENSQIIPYKKSKRSRSACGISEDGRYLYLLCVASNRVSDRSGLSYEDCAEIFLQLGCTDAIQFDGGHSTSMFCPEFGITSSKNPRKIPAALGFYLNNAE